MIKRLLIILGVCFIGVVSVFAEQVVNPSFPQITGSFQQDENSGVFFRAEGKYGPVIFSNTGGVISSYGFGNSYSDTFINIRFPSKLLFTSAINGYFNYQRNFGSAVLDLGNSSILGGSQNGFPGITGNMYHGVSTNRGCQQYKHLRMAVNKGKLILQVFGNNGQYCNGQGAYYMTSTSGSGSGLFEPYSGSTITGTWKYNYEIDNSYVQIISGNAMIYKKTGVDDSLFILECNDFAVCTESLLFKVTNMTAGYKIKAFKFYYTSSNGSFGYVNLYMSNGTQGGIMYLPFTLDENGAFVYGDYVHNKWIKSQYVEGGGYKLFIVGEALASNGISPKFGIMNPLVIWEDNLVSQDDFWYVKDDDKLYNFGSSFSGSISENTGGGGGSSGSGGTATGSTIEGVDWNADKDNDGSISIGELVSFVGGIFGKIGSQAVDLIEGFKRLIYEFSKIGDFSLVGKAYADIGDYDRIGPVIGNMQVREGEGIESWFRLYKAFLFLVVGTIFIILFIAFKRG